MLTGRRVPEQAAEEVSSACVAPVEAAPPAPVRPASAAAPAAADSAGAGAPRAALSHGLERDPRVALALARSAPDLSWAQRLPEPRGAARTALQQGQGSGSTVAVQSSGSRAPPGAQLPYALSSEGSDCTASSGAEAGPCATTGSCGPGTATSGPARTPLVQEAEPSAAAQTVPERAPCGSGTVRSDAGTAPAREPAADCEGRSSTQRPARDSAAPSWVLACRVAAAPGAAGGSGREALSAARAGAGSGPTAHAGLTTHALRPNPCPERALPLHHPAALAPARPLVLKLPPLAELCALEDGDSGGGPAPCPGGARSSNPKHPDREAGAPARRQASLEEVRARIARRRAARAAADAGGVWVSAVPEAGACPCCAAVQP